MRITNHEQIREMFLRYDKDRNGFISRENIQDIFRQINLPLENDLIDAVRYKTKNKSHNKSSCTLDGCRMYN